MMVSSGANIGISTWDETLSPTDFCIAARAFAEKWKELNSVLPKWSCVSCPKRPWFAAQHVEGYLSLEDVFIPMSIEEDHDADSHRGTEECDCSDEDEPTDNAILVQGYKRELHHYNFHVVYSSPTGSQCFIFGHTAQRERERDGQPLALEDIENDLPASSAKVLKECKWTFIIQEEHIYLNRPRYTLHPCGASEWMKLLLANCVSADSGRVLVEQYLVPWFSVVGPVVGLRFPLEMLVKTNDPVFSNYDCSKQMAA